MTNREELEKMFDVMLSKLDWDIEYWELKLRNSSDIKKYLFDTIIPEVLREILPEYKDTQTKDDEINSMRYWRNDCISEFKQKAKKIYWIDL